MGKLITSGECNEQLAWFCIYIYIYIYICIYIYKYMCVKDVKTNFVDHMLKTILNNTIL